MPFHQNWTRLRYHIEALRLTVHEHVERLVLIEEEAASHLNARDVSTVENSEGVRQKSLLTRLTISTPTPTVPRIALVARAVLPYSFQKFLTFFVPAPPLNLLFNRCIFWYIGRR